MIAGSRVKAERRGGDRGARASPRYFRAPAQDAVTALDNVSVTIRENEFFTLLGPSGCGKTTLLRLIAGFDFPTEGEILPLWRGHRALAAAIKRPVNTVFQNYALFPHMTVGQNIGFGLEMLGKPQGRDRRARRADAEARAHGGTASNRRTSQISGGQQQRVALARALAPQPKVLLLDEPLSALDFKLRKDMQIELKRLQHETGITFIFVTHDQEEALTMSDRIAVMSKGRILQIGTPRDIYDRPAERFVANFIGETNFLEGEVRRSAQGKARIALAVGRDVDAGLPEGLKPSRQGHHRGAGPNMPTSSRHGPVPQRLTARSRTSSISAPTRIITSRSTAAASSSSASRTAAARVHRLQDRRSRSASPSSDDAAQVLRD